METAYKFAKLATILLSVYWVTDVLQAWHIEMYSADILHGLNALSDVHITTEVQK